MRRNLASTAFVLLLSCVLGADPTETRSSNDAVALQPQAAAATTSGPDKYCPLWPIFDMGGGDYLFYCETHLAGSGCLEPIPTCSIENTEDWPCYCDEAESCCRTIAKIAANGTQQFKAQPFKGHGKKLSSGFKPGNPGAGDPKPHKDLKMAETHTGFYKLSFEHPKGTWRYAKLFMVQPRRNGNHSANDPLIAIAYEVEEKFPSSHFKVENKHVKPTREPGALRLTHGIPIIVLLK